MTVPPIPDPKRKACRDAARDAFERIRRAFPHLRFEMDDPSKDDDGQIDVRVPCQPGLVFDVWMNLQNEDELHLAIGDKFWVEWFPCNKPEKSEAFVEAVCGVLSGKWRVVEWWLGKRPTKAYLQKPISNDWITVCGGSDGSMYIPWPWLKFSTRIFQNKCTN